MKKIFLFLLLPIVLIGAFVFTSGCTKDCDVTAVNDSTTISNTSWTLLYNEGTSGNPIYYAPQTFINNGVATMPTNLYRASKFFTVYDLPLPKEIITNLDTDSLKLVARVRNVNGDGTANEIDLALIYNTISSAQAQASWQKGSVATFCLLGITNQTINNVTEQLTNPSVYSEYAISVQGNNVTSYKDAVLLKSTSYSGTIGTLKTVRVAFRGYGEIDWVKLFKGNKLIMTEDFNTNGTTTAIWSKP